MADSFQKQVVANLLLETTVNAALYCGKNLESAILAQLLIKSDY